MTQRALSTRSVVSVWLSVALVLSTVLLTSRAHAQRDSANAEVRQIVTFHFSPGRTAEALAIYEKQLKPVYADVSALRRFRAYREAESPEPLDLIVVSSYDGMSGMDVANQALRRPHASGVSAFALYGTLAAMTQSHHDQFVEIVPTLSDAVGDATLLTVFEYIRVVPGRQGAFERATLNSARPFEKSRGLYQWSETGRLLVSDGWDMLRIYGIRSLGDWQRAQQQLRTASFAGEVGALIAARKTIIVRPDVGLFVR